MGKALYREYRPKSLSEVIGQEHITNTLSNAIKNNSISHAYLFTGPRGVGKTSVARIFAHEINNIDYNDESIELDIIEIDAASNRRIDEVRDLRDKVHIAPTNSKYKVYIIDEVHMLTREAFNALLKTLEEPPEHAVFILATTESHKVPDTIISRTQRFNFKPIYNNSAVEHLRFIADKEKISITDEALELIAEHGNGSFRDSISMLDQITGFESSEITAENISSLLGFPETNDLDKLILSVRNSNVDDLFMAIQSLKEKGANSAKIAQTLIKKLRDDITSEESVLSSKKAVTIMKSLLPFTGAQSNFESIEIVLLDSIDFTEEPIKTKIVSSKSSIQATEIKEKTIKTDDNKDQEAAYEEVKIPEDTDSEVTEVTSSTTKSQQNSNWNDVLNSLKEHNNTLYGVLRMAETRVDKDRIILTFQFEFHKKQLNNSKNITTLKKIVDEQLGEGYIIESEVVKKQKKSSPKPAPKEDNSSISSVSNIFGGAELLES